MGKFGKRVMRSLSIGLWMLYSSVLTAETLPDAPANCIDDIELTGFCSEMEAGTFTGPIELKFFLLIESDPDLGIDQALDTFLQFDLWPDYAMAAEADNIHYRTSLAMPPVKDEMGSVVYRHYADFKIKAPIIQWQNIRSVTHHYYVTPFEGAVKSLRFEVQNEGSQDIPIGEEPLDGSVGIKSQTGYLHAVDCANSQLCADGQALLIYETVVKPDIDLLPKVAGGAIRDVIQNLMIGMYLR